MSTRPHTRAAAFAAAIVASLALTGLGASGASAAFDVDAFDGGSFEQSGQASTQAGLHPFQASATIKFKETVNSAGERVVDGSAPRDIYVDLPPGLIGNPLATPRCAPQDFYQPGFFFPACPLNTQVGVTNVDTNEAAGPGPYPVYNLIPPPGKPAAFGFKVSTTPVVVTASLRSDGDYGVTVEAEKISQALPIFRTEFTLWGTPADSSHDGLRGECADPFSGPTGLLCPSQAPRVPLLTNPTACTAAGVGLETGLRTDPWLQSGAFVHKSFLSHQAPGYPLPPSEWGPQVGPEGCAKVPFDPSLRVKTTSSQADSPTGLDVELSVPTSGLLNQTGLSQSALKKAVVTLPEGMSVNPAAANGLGSCSEAQLQAETATSAAGAGCPQNAKIGTVAIDTPLLDQPLDGAVYLADQYRNPFKSLLALYIIAKSPERGVVIRLKGQVQADPRSGRLVTSFDDNPQLPFSHLTVSLNGGPTAPLINPPACGRFSVGADLYPWARPDAPVASSDSFAIASGPEGSPCNGLGGFTPSFRAGTLSPLAGAFSPLVLNTSRADGSQPFSGLQFSLPEGLLGRLAGIPYCPDAALAAAAGKSGTDEAAVPSCPAASRVGGVDVRAGAGPIPYQVQGQAYLSGPYKGAPLSFAVITPAVAGPFDLGTVVTRAAAYVDATSAQVKVVSDPLPTILQGIPLKIRSIAINNDRPEFTLNPTSCDPMEVTGALSSIAGSTANRSSRFQVGGCGELAFGPKLSLKLSGKTKRSGNPALTAVLTQPTGANANIAKTAVILPKSEFIDNAHINNPCTRVQFNADQCPAKSILGSATAYTPLLDEPLKGPVYFRSNGGERELPDLVADLGGQIHVTLVGFIDSVKTRGSESSRVRTRFQSVPDAPVSRFVLKLYGGERGLIVNSVNLCKAKPKATVKMEGQNGKFHDFQQKIGTDCRKPKGKKSKH